MEVSNAPALMSAWANEVDRRGEVKGGGRERAMAVEGLLKRMIDERRAGNADAIARTEDYNAVMKSWATSGERSAAALRVEQVSFFCSRGGSDGVAGDRFVRGPLVVSSLCHPDCARRPSRTPRLITLRCCIAPFPP